MKRVESEPVEHLVTACCSILGAELLRDVRVLHAEGVKVKP